MTNPCFKCSDRSPTCHAECDKYKTFADEREKERDEAYRNRVQKSLIIDSRIETVRRIKRRNGRK